MVIGSYDPNDILVDRDYLFDTEVQGSAKLEYTVRFQNTGNDTAFVVKVLNPIDTAALIPSSFEFISSSHPVNVEWMSWNQSFRYTFNNILLPDSNVNEPESHGFIRYKIRTKPTLNVGYKIFNGTYIYFDYNDPVATNLAETEIILFTGIKNADNHKLTINPNPVSDQFRIKLEELNYGNLKIEILDITGRNVSLLYDGNFEGGDFEKVYNTGTISSGTYLLKISGTVNHSYKIIKL